MFLEHESSPHYFLHAYFRPFVRILLSNFGRVRALIIEQCNGTTSSLFSYISVFIDTKVDLSEQLRLKWHEFARTFPLQLLRNQKIRDFSQSRCCSYAYGHVWLWLSSLFCFGTASRRVHGSTGDANANNECSKTQKLLGQRD